MDGGSRFITEFEQACEELKIALIVLQPAKPKYNGDVESANRTFREEFYNMPGLLADSIGALRAEYKNALHQYNNFRPYKALDRLTPVQYVHNAHAA